MKLSSTCIVLLTVVQTEAFVASSSFQKRVSTATYNYLDDLKKYTAPPEEEEEKDDSIAATTLAKDKQDRYGVGDWGDFQDFEEFDGGDGQMGVAGDGEKGLSKMGSSPSFASSKMMSAKNAWGTSSGYAEKLREDGMETSRAQQLENWANQQEVKAKKDQMKAKMENYDTVQSSEEENWRSLAKFGIERNSEFDMQAAFGENASVGEVTDTIEINSRVNEMSYNEFSLKNEYMGFADFRAAFTPDTDQGCWTVEPADGSLSKEPVNFIVKFRPNQPGINEGYLVIETEDFKKTYKLIGNTA